jgi:hypothetical protein
MLIKTEKNLSKKKERFFSVFIFLKKIVFTKTEETHVLKESLSAVCLNAFHQGKNQRSVSSSQRERCPHTHTHPPTQRPRTSVRTERGAVGADV